ncbi:MAG: hypothetical protein B7Z15_06280 [Rhizobiales bacterium 32-66-8]|nr:MAG: hypothetical protein B7Z15_06280 [Rhizobiales bacterium 32-66-8]
MTDKADHGDIIIIRRHEEDEHEAHSSAWKVAHADFMTAMMAFFLIMWLINATDKDTRKAIANYFNPVDLASSITDVKGLNEPEDTKAMGTSSDGDKSSTLKNTVGPKAGAGDDRQNGTGNGDAYRDPFDPVYWQISAARKAKSEQQSSAKIASPDGARPDAVTPRPEGVGPEATAPQDPAQKPPTATQKAAAEQAALQLQSELETVVKATIGTQAPKVEVRATREGLVINLTDDIDFSMFPVGSAIPDPRVVRAMEKIAKVLESRPGNVVIRGHTDARPFRSETYDNWRLSTARAHMAHYMLVRGGLDEKRMLKIEGTADRELKNTADPNAAQNRRIEILLKSPS